MWHSNNVEICRLKLHQVSAAHVQQILVTLDWGYLPSAFGLRNMGYTNQTMARFGYHLPNFFISNSEPIWEPQSFGAHFKGWRRYQAFLHGTVIISYFQIKSCSYERYSNPRGKGWATGLCDVRWERKWVPLNFSAWALIICWTVADDT